MKNTLRNYSYHTSKHTNKDLHQQFFFDLVRFDLKSYLDPRILYHVHTFSSTW